MCRRLTCLWVVLVLGAGQMASAELVGWWKLDEGAGTAISDSSGNELDGTFTGGAPEWITGRYGGAIQFKGTGGYVDLGPDPAMDLTEEITVACWLKDDGFTTGWQAVFTKGLGWRLQRQTTLATLEWTCPGLVIPTPYLFSNGTVDSGEWHHVAGIYDGQRQALFIDGELDVEMEASGQLDSTAYHVMIGSIDTLTERVWNGPIDDVRLYSHGMSQEEIQYVMNNELYPFAAGPQPADGSMIGATSVTLGWRPGEAAVSHNVYFSESFDDVNDGVVAAIATTETSLKIGTTPPYASGLTPGQTYYWRVDEIDEGNPDSPWKGRVWSFQVQPAVAWDPFPPDGGTYTSLDQVLSWQKGLGALFHTMFFGEDFDEINDATSSMNMLTELTYDPGSLVADRTYYWRVDEYTPGGNLKGDVWSFTTMPEIAPADDPNLLLSWSLDEGAGSMSAVDWSGQGHHGILRNGPQWTDGYDGGALQFDGMDDYVSAPLDVSETVYTAALWIQTVNPNCGVLGIVDGDLGDGGWDRMLYLTGGALGARIYSDEVITTSGLNLADGRWHHIVHTYGAAIDGQRLYVDGVLRASGVKASSDFDWQKRINVGWSADAAEDYFEGTVDEVRVYDRILSEEEIQQLIRGNALLAWAPDPTRGAVVDVLGVTSLRWSPGDTAASHDVYLGQDRDAVAAADPAAPEYQGNRTTLTFSLAGLVAFGGGDYYWRIDEVEADGTVHAGRVWKFSVPDYLIVDDFESYTNESPNRVFQTWIDGMGFSADEHYPDGDPGNGTGALVGHDIWSSESPYYGGQIMEVADAHSGQAMPLYYDNSTAPYYSEAERTWATAQNWTAEGVTDLVLYVRGEADNEAAPVYVAVGDSSNCVGVVTHADAEIATETEWVEWKIPLADFTGAGVSLTAVKKMYIGVGSRTAPTADGAGVLYVDDIRLVRP